MLENWLYVSWRIKHEIETCHDATDIYLPEYFSVCIWSVGTAKFPVAFGGHPFRFCCVRRVWVACKDGPRGGTSGGAGSGGESLPVSAKSRARTWILCVSSRHTYACVVFKTCIMCIWKFLFVEILLFRYTYICQAFNLFHNFCRDFYSK